MNPDPSDPVDRWRPFDEAVTVTFETDPCGRRPLALHWRGSLWRVVGESLHWSTWRALPVAPSRPDHHPPPLGLRTDFWRFHAQSDPVSPLLHFEVRRAGAGWRLVRLGATFALPDRSTTEPSATDRSTTDLTCDGGAAGCASPVPAGGVGARD